MFQYRYKEVTIDENSFVLVELTNYDTEDDKRRAYHAIQDQHEGSWGKSRSIALVDYRQPNGEYRGLNESWYINYRERTGYVPGKVPAAASPGITETPWSDYFRL